MYWDRERWQQITPSEPLRREIVQALTGAHVDAWAADHLIDEVHRCPLSFFRFHDLYEIRFTKGHLSRLFEKPLKSPHQEALLGRRPKGDWRGYVLLSHPDAPSFVRLDEPWLSGESGLIYEAGRACADVDGVKLANLCFEPDHQGSRDEKILDYVEFYSAFLQSATNDGQFTNGTYIFLPDEGELERFLTSAEEASRSQLASFIIRRKAAAHETGCASVPVPRDPVTFDSGRPRRDRPEVIATTDSHALINGITVCGPRIDRSLLAVATDPNDRETFGRISMILSKPVEQSLFLPSVRFVIDTSARVPFLDLEEIDAGEAGSDDAPYRYADRLGVGDLQRRVLPNTGQNVRLITKAHEFLALLRGEIQHRNSHTESGSHHLKNLIIACDIEFDSLMGLAERGGAVDQREGFHDEQTAPAGAFDRESAGRTIDALLRGNMTISNSVILGNFGLSFQECHRTINFEDCVFMGNFQLSYGSIGGALRIADSTFGGAAVFDGLKVKGSFLMERCHFVHPEPIIRMRSLDVAGEVRLRSVRMDGRGMIDAPSTQITGRLVAQNLFMSCDRKSGNSKPGWEISRRSGGAKRVTAPSTSEFWPLTNRFGVNFMSSRITGGVSFKADRLFMNEIAANPKVDPLADQEGEIDRAWQHLLAEEGQALIEAAVHPPGWMDVIAHLRERQMRPDQKEESNQTELYLVQNVICGNLSFRSARIRAGADFRGIRIINVQQEGHGDLDLVHAEISGDLNAGTLAISDYPAGVRAESGRKCIDVAIAPTDIDGHLAARFLTVHGNVQLHGPKRERIFDEIWDRRETGGDTCYQFSCDILLSQHCNNYKTCLVAAAGKFWNDRSNKDPEEGGQNGARLFRSTKVTLDPIRITEHFTPPFSFAHIGMGLDLRHATIEGHLDITNVRTDVLESDEARRQNRDTEVPGRCEVRLADANIGGDLRALSDRKDGLYDLDSRTGRRPSEMGRDKVAAMQLKCVCARLDLESVRVHGDAHLSGLVILRLGSPSSGSGIREHRSGSLYAADATISGQFTLERRENYFGRPKRAHIARELVLSGAKIGELIFSARIFEGDRSGFGISLENAEIDHMRIRAPSPLFANLDHISVKHWDLLGPADTVYLNPCLNCLNSPPVRFGQSMTAFLLWLSVVGWTGLLLAVMSGLLPRDFRFHGLVSHLFNVSIVLVFVQMASNLVDAVKRSFNKRVTGRSIRGFFFGDLVRIAAIPLLVSWPLWPVLEAAYGSAGALFLIWLLWAVLQLYLHIPMQILNLVIYIFTGRKWIDFLLKLEEIRRDQHLPRPMRRYPCWLHCFARGVLCIYPRVFHGYDSVNSNPYLALLTKSRPFQANAYVEMSNTLELEGREGDARQVFRAMKERDRRESTTVYRDFIGATWRFVFERSLIFGVLGYGTRYFVLVLLWLMLFGFGFFIFSHPDNTRPLANEGGSAPGDGEGGRPPAEQGDRSQPPSTIGTRWFNGVVLGLKYAVPLIQLKAASEPGVKELKKIKCPDIEIRRQGGEAANAGPGGTEPVGPEGIYSLCAPSEIAKAYLWTARDVLVGSGSWLRGYESEAAPGPLAYSMGMSDWPPESGHDEASKDDRETLTDRRPDTTPGGTDSSAQAGVLEDGPEEHSNVLFTPRNTATVIEILAWIIFPLFIAQITGLIRWRSRLSRE